MEKLHYRIRVVGQVQGVWYRKSAAEKAISLGIQGYVMNRPDGSVYMEAEGTHDALLQLLQWCAEGPPLALVATVEHETSAWVGYRSFETRR